MFTKKSFLLFLLAFSFSSLMSFEHLTHIDAHDSTEIYQLDCEYSQNSKAPKLYVNVFTIPFFPVELSYFIDLKIHNPLLEKNFNSRAPPQK